MGTTVNMIPVLLLRICRPKPSLRGTMVPSALTSPQTPLSSSLSKKSSHPPRCDIPSPAPTRVPTSATIPTQPQKSQQELHQTGPADTHADGQSQTEPRSLPEPWPDSTRVRQGPTK